MGIVVTGFPTSFLATRVVRDRLRRTDEDVWCVVQSQHLRAAERLRDEWLSTKQRGRLRLLEGDTASLDLGLSGSEFMMLAREVRTIHHCAAVTWLGVRRAEAERCNVAGAREVLELAEAAPDLERLVHWSSALVSGKRKGRVMEQELRPRGFRNVVEETRMRAERIIRDGVDVPTTILRPSIVVGDSESGEVDRLDGPYLLVLLMLGSPADLRMPMPGRGDAPLNLVPIDYVLRAGMAIVESPDSIGRTYHIVDPEPLTARRVYELIARAAQRPVPRGFVPTAFATTLMKTPGLERFANMPRSFLEQLATEVVWDDRNARPILESAGLRCPPFESYVDAMVKFTEKHQAERALSSIDLGFEETDLPA